MNVTTILQDVNFNLNSFIAAEKWFNSLHRQRRAIIYAVWTEKSPEVWISKIWLPCSSWQMSIPALWPMAAEKTALACKLSFSSHQKQGQWLLDSGSWSRNKGCSAQAVAHWFSTWSLLLRHLEERRVPVVFSRSIAGQSLTKQYCLLCTTEARRTLPPQPWLSASFLSRRSSLCLPKLIKHSTFRSCCWLALWCWAMISQIGSSSFMMNIS